MEGDWSGAAFLLVAGAIAGSVTVKGLDMHSAQADKRILDVLKMCGAEILINEKKYLYKIEEFDMKDLD